MVANNGVQVKDTTLVRCRARPSAGRSQARIWRRAGSR